MAQRDSRTAPDPTALGDPDVEEEHSACGACGKTLRGTPPGELHFCPTTYRSRLTRFLTDDELAILDDYESADPAGRER